MDAPIVQPFHPEVVAVPGSSSLGYVLEPAIVISLLATGVWLNRRNTPRSPPSFPYPASPSSPASPNGARDTSRYANNWISRTLYRLPFILEVIYWALTYWIYQIARAISAVLFIDEGTVDLARRHGIQVVEAERAMGIQWENGVQEWIMRTPWLLNSLNRIYSFIHIPATIAFLAYFYRTQRFNVYAPARRTLALANLLAFVVFTLWPCMPPRLLPKSYGFIDTVHRGAVSSVWTTNKFCNQYAAMPSLHFGYSLIVGWSLFANTPAGTRSRWRRMGLHYLFMGYPTLILLAIVATANHYLLDAAAGFVVAVLALQANAVLLRLLPLENYVFDKLHIHKPPPAGRAEAVGAEEGLPRFAYEAVSDGSAKEKRRSCGSFVFTTAEA